MANFIVRSFGKPQLYLVVIFVLSSWSRLRYEHTTVVVWKGKEKNAARFPILAVNSTSSRRIYTLRNTSRRFKNTICSRLKLGFLYRSLIRGRHDDPRRVTPDFSPLPLGKFDVTLYGKENNKYVLSRFPSARVTAGRHFRPLR